MKRKIVDFVTLEDLQKAFKEQKGLSISKHGEEYVVASDEKVWNFSMRSALEISAMFGVDLGIVYSWTYNNKVNQYKSLVAKRDGKLNGFGGGYGVNDAMQMGELLKWFDWAGIELSELKKEMEG